jgi:hypothetical protein
VVSQNLMRHFTKADVLGAGRCRLVVFGKVYELGELLDERKGDPGAKALLEAQGTDISHWFKNASGQIRTARIENEEYDEVPFSPVGNFLDLTTPPGEKKRWWEDDQYVIGPMAKRTRLVKVENVLTGQMALLDVPVDETLRDIQLRYENFNFHASSYTWKFLGRVLDLEKTLDQNAIPELQVSQIAMDVPVLHVYFNDDLTEA